MCESTSTVKVKISADLSHTGESYLKNAEIDACISGLVKELQAAGINMRASCCGHGKAFGSILLQDGKKLIILQR